MNLSNQVEDPEELGVSNCLEDKSATKQEKQAKKRASLLASKEELLSSTLDELIFQRKEESLETKEVRVCKGSSTVTLIS
jgi:hypothetical protein